MNLKQFTALKEKIESLQTKASKADGALEQVQKELKKDLGCKDLKEAEKKLKEMEKQDKELEEERDKEWVKFEKKYGFLLEDD